MANDMLAARSTASMTATGGMCARVYLSNVDTAEIFSVTIAEDTEEEHTFAFRLALSRFGRQAEHVQCVRVGADWYLTSQPWLRLALTRTPQDAELSTLVECLQDARRRDPALGSPLAPSCLMRRGHERGLLTLYEHGLRSSELREEIERCLVRRTRSGTSSDLYDL